MGVIGKTAAERKRRAIFFWLFAVIGLILLRLVLLLLAVNGIPSVDVVKDDWLFNAGSDARSYFRTARDFPEQGFKLNPLGFPLILMPFVKLSGAQQLNEIAKPVVLLQSVVFYVLATLLVYLLALLFLKKKYKAFIVAAFFNVYPYLFYYFLHFFGSQTLILQRSNEVVFMWFMFFGILTEPLSTVLLLLSLLLLLKISESKKEAFGVALLLGLASGWAVLTRFQNLVIGPFYALVLLVLKKFKSFAFFVLAALPFLFLQLFGDYVATGSALGTGYNFSDREEMPFGFFSYKYLERLIRYPLENCPLFFVPMVLGAVLLGFGIYKVIKENKKTGLVLSGYLFCNTFFILFLEPTLRNPRYFLPVLPVVFILIYAGLECLGQLILSRKK